MTPKNLEDLYIHRLRDLYSAESQLLDALPKMAAKAHHDELRRAFESHLEQTKQQRRRLEQIFEGRGMSPSGVTCRAIKGLIKESEEHIAEAKSLFGEDAPPAVLDANLIADAQSVEHYEIAGYGTAATYAEMLGHQDEHDLLSTTLSEEKSTDQKLNEMAKGFVNIEAVMANGRG